MSSAPIVKPDTRAAARQRGYRDGYNGVERKPPADDPERSEYLRSYRRGVEAREDA